MTRGSPRRAKSPVVLLATRSGTANGASLNASRLAAAFRSAGVPASAWSIYSTDGVVTPGIDRCFSLAPPSSPIAVATVLLRCSAAILRQRPAAVIGFHPMANVVGLLAALLSGVRVRVATQRNPATSQRPLLRTLDRIAGTVGLYTRNVCVSPAVTRTYASYPRAYRRRVETIWNGVPESPHPAASGAVRAELGLPADLPLIGTVGRLDPQKNQTVLIDALERAAHAHLVLAGDGVLFPQLHARAVELGVQDRVHFLGRVPGDRVSDVLAALDVFAFPSVYEGFGLALVEAMRAGLPCVVSDIDVFRDILGADRRPPSGLLVPPDQPRAWADAFIRLEEDPALADRLGAAAQAESHRFRFDAMAEAYLALLRP